MRFSRSLTARGSLGLLAICLVQLAAGVVHAADDLYYYRDGARIELAPTGQVDPLGNPLFLSDSSVSTSALTSQLVVQVRTGSDIQALARSWGARAVQAVDYAPDLFVVEVASPLDSLRLAHQAVERGEALAAEPQFAQQRSTRDVPNDFYFASNHWNLLNTGQAGGMPGIDINVTPWWDFAGGTRLGAGVNIAVVDDGLQHTHPELSPNYKPALSIDINQGDFDPSPALSVNFHGTAVAGIAAARGNNGIGVTGVAPHVGLSGIRLLASTFTDAQYATSQTYQNNNQGGLGTNDIYSNSWGLLDTGTLLGGPGLAGKAALASGATTGRGGKGSIFVYSGGNGQENYDNANYDGYANSRYVIAVSATRNDNNGSQSSYSEPGANLFLNAPSSGGTLWVPTTDLVGSDGYSPTDYAIFSGTSASAPEVAGAVALMLEANGNLTWRDVKHILAHSSTKNDPGHPDWVTNAAGLHVNHWYGFGRLDANAAATLASTWTNVGPEVSESSASLPNLNLAIPDGGDASYDAPLFGPPLTNSLTLSEPIKLETVEVTVNVTHPLRGDLEFSLTAPTGTVSLLGGPRPDDGANFTNWTFTTVHDWDELAAGTWTLSIRDGVIGNEGLLKSWSISAYGTLVPEPGSFVLMLLGGLGLLMGKKYRRRAGS